MVFNNLQIKRKRRKKKTKTEFKSTTKCLKINKSLKSNKTINKYESSKINKNKKKISERLKKYKNNMIYTDSELNSLSYEEALKFDERNYCQYYFSLLKKKQSILFSFYPNKDYNSQIIKIFLFFFFYGLDLTINALFFTDNTMHKIYIDSGSFDFSYQLPQIIYSSIISNIINFIIEYLSLSENTIISIKSKINLHGKNHIINKMKIKFCFFFVITFILLLIFLFYVLCFCCIYQNTQIHLIKDSLLSFAFSSILPFFLCLIPGIFRFLALNSKKSNKSYLYKLSQMLEFI